MVNTQRINMEELIDWIMMDLNHPKVKTACEWLNINWVNVCTTNKEDFFNKEFLDILYDEFNETRNAIHDQMELESTMPEHQLFGCYIPADTWTEALFILNTLIANVMDLLELIQE